MELITDRRGLLINYRYYEVNDVLSDEEGTFYVAITESTEMNQFLEVLSKLRKRKGKSNFIGLSTYENRDGDIFAKYMILSSPKKGNDSIPTHLLSRDVSTISDTIEVIGRDSQADLWFPFNYKLESSSRQLSLPFGRTPITPSGRTITELSEIIPKENGLPEQAVGYFNLQHGRVIFPLGIERGLDIQSANDLVEKIARSSGSSYQLEYRLFS